MLASELRYRALFDDNPLPMWVYNRETLRFVDVNNAAIQTYGFSREEFLEMSVLAIRPEEHISNFLKYLESAGEDDSNITLHRTKEGRILNVEVTRRVLQPGGKEVLVLANDLTEKLQAQQSLALAIEVLNTVAAFVLIADSTGRITYVSPSIAALGYGPPEVLGDGWWNLTRPEEEERRRTKQEIASIALGRIPVSRTPYETVVQCKDGSLKCVLWQDSAQIPGFVIGVGQDITERKATEEALARSEARFRRLVESNVVGVNFSSINGPVFEANDAYLNLIGYTRAELESGKLRWDKITPPEYRPIDEQAVEDLRLRGVCPPIEKEYIRKDGARVPVLLGIAMMPDSETDCICVAIDLTDRKRLEQERRELSDQLVQSHKMEAIGQLAGGIAHDFNNILNVIGGYTELMMNKLSVDHPLRHNTERVLAAAKRAADLTAQLLAFSRKQVLSAIVLNLNSAIADILEMLRRLIREDIQLVFSPAADLDLVRADKTQIEQVIINLTVNARDAMPSGGTLKIETSNVRNADISGLPAGDYVSVVVSDTGIGMDKETLSHIFEPFFTTKKFGQGTGLGLSTVYGIVKQSGGEIVAESNPGHGTIFTLYLPKTEASVRSAMPQEPSYTIGRGGETILLVEDEADLRNATCEYLEELGYTVLAAKDGEEALEIAANYPGCVHLLVTDLVMPKLSGRSVYQEVRQLRPSVKTIFISGYADEMTQSSASEPGVTFLAKPFLLRELGKLVREISDSDASPRLSAKAAHGFGANRN